MCNMINKLKKKLKLSSIIANYKLNKTVTENQNLSEFI